MLTANTKNAEKEKYNKNTGTQSHLYIYYRETRELSNYESFSG